MLARWNPAHWTARAWLVVLVLAFAALSFELSALRYIEFGGSNFDLGLYSQSLWSQSHGFGLFESADYGSVGATSFLRIHPALIMFGLAPIYGVAPFPWTLFAIQSVVVSLAAIPLFYLAADLSRSRRKGLLAAGLYLVWAPLLAANLFDFHLEAFLPLELLALFLLWFRGRYLWGLVPAAFACLTFEAGPVFVFLIGLFFILFPEESQAGRRAQGYGVSHGVGGRSPWSVALLRIRAGLLRPPGQYSLLLMAIGVVTYFVLTSVSLGAGTVVGASLPREPLAVIAAGPPTLGLSLAELGNLFLAKVLGWSIVLALVAYLPFRAPKTLLLLVPWVVVTFFAGARFVALGNQELFVATFPIFVGVAYGLSDLDLTLPSWIPASAGVGVRAPSRSVVDQPRARGRWKPGWAAVFGLVVVVNLLLSPIDPLVQSDPFAAGSLGGGYVLGYETPRGYPELERVVSHIPAGSPVLASDVLFPFVANNPHAFGLSYLSPPPLFSPFNATNLPRFFLLSDQEFASVPGWLVRAISDHSRYGLVGWVGGTTAGSAFLYQLGYHGPSLAYDEGGFASTTYEWPALSPATIGELQPAPGTTSVYRITSIATQSGIVWYGPGVTLPPGRYSVVTNLEVHFVDRSLLSTPGKSVFGIAVSALGQVFRDTSYTVAQLENGTVISLTTPLILVEPTLRMDFHGAQFVPGLEVTLDSVIVLPQGG